MVWTIVITAAITVLAVVLAMNFATPGEEARAPARAPLRGRRPAIPARDGRSCSAPAILARQQGARLQNGDEIFPAMLEAIARRSADDHLRDLYLLVGRDRQTIHRRAVRARPGRRQVHVHRSTGSAASRWTRSCSNSMRGGRACAVQPLPSAALVQPEPPQQPHPPQAAGGGRPDRLHRRRGHRRPVARPCAGSRALARIAFPHRGAGGCADAGRVQRQLDQDHRRGAQRRALFPAAGAGRRTSTPICSSLRRRAAARACT